MIKHSLCARSVLSELTYIVQFIPSKVAYLPHVLLRKLGTKRLERPSNSDLTPPVT